MKRIILLVGPKGAGKSTIGELLEQELGLRFVRVEPVFMATREALGPSSPDYERRGFEAVLARLKDELADAETICFESTGASGHFRWLVAELGRLALVLPVQVLAEPSQCVDRIHQRDSSIHIPVSDDQISRINSVAVQVTMPWAAQIDNRGPFNPDLILHRMADLLITPPDRKVITLNEASQGDGDDLRRYLDPFVDGPGSRAEATRALAGYGVDALPILVALFTGSAKNQWGVPYQQFAEALRCGIIVARYLGPDAQPLEGQLVTLLRNHDDTIGWEAALALEALGTLEAESIRALAARLDARSDVATQSAVTLIRCGHAVDPLVDEVIAGSPRAAEVLERARRFIERSEQH